jgi:hypothetical protein
MHYPKPSIITETSDSGLPAAIYSASAACFFAFGLDSRRVAFKEAFLRWR